MDVHRAARISQKLLLTHHGHHVQTLVVAVVVVVVKRSRRTSSWIESSVSVLSVSEEEVER